MTRNHHEAVIFQQTYKRMIRHLQATSDMWHEVHSRNQRHLRKRWFIVAYKRRVNPIDKTESNSHD